MDGVGGGPAERGAGWGAMPRTTQRGRAAEPDAGRGRGVLRDAVRGRRRGWRGRAGRGQHGAMCGAAPRMERVESGGRARA